MNECKFGNIDCKHLNSEDEFFCDLNCFDGEKYDPIKTKKPGYIKKNLNKASKRMGSATELNVQKKAQESISTEANLTPNSGAGSVKGDMIIEGYLKAMFECKTQEIVRAKGHKSFTVKREWLDKLKTEAKEAFMEFWALIFSFKDNDETQYSIVEYKLLLDFVATVVHDRKLANEAQSKIDIADKRRLLAEAEATKLYAENELLKAILKKYNINPETGEKKNE